MRPISLDGSGQILGQTPIMDRAREWIALSFSDFHCTDMDFWARISLILLMGQRQASQSFNVGPSRPSSRSSFNGQAVWAPFPVNVIFYVQ